MGTKLRRRRRRRWRLVSLRECLMTAQAPTSTGCPSATHDGTPSNASEWGPDPRPTEHRVVQPWRDPLGQGTPPANRHGIPRTGESSRTADPTARSQHVARRARLARTTQRNKDHAEHTARTSWRASQPSNRAMVGRARPRTSLDSEKDNENLTVESGTQTEAHGERRGRHSLIPVPVPIPQTRTREGNSTRFRCRPRPPTSPRRS